MKTLFFLNVFLHFFVLVVVVQYLFFNSFSSFHYNNIKNNYPRANKEKIYQQ